MTGITELQRQLESAAIATAELEHIGVRVISASCFLHQPRAKLLVADPGHLLDAIDAQMVDTSGVSFTGRGVVYRDCHVFWIVGHRQSHSIANTIEDFRA